ncbi:AAA family ATPase [Saccharophagus degradans]|uniref:AAA family ATPase n=1 Tax=Saccharophagus degradans TaxID=86304 RepID=A0AAW7X144_9GAMM|nr:AAA family ATPase [Saccharophagus degradans]MDO6421338.1 AAA family ATPase [Saccharophagus degradans]MDO6605751.1 AAA family ATPase [Saccharophagus degradans]
MKQGKLFFFCGKMGAGKSTRSRIVAAENGAALISEDDWLSAHYPEQIQTSEHELWYLDLSDEQCLSEIAQRRIEQPERAHFDTEAVFRHVTQYFEVPAGDENLNIIKVSESA